MSTVIDITRAWAGTAHATISRVLEVDSSSSSLVIALPGQLQTGDAMLNATLHELSSNRPSDEDVIAALAALPQAPDVVYSFSDAVSAYVVGGLKARFVHLRTFRGVPRSAPPTAWPEHVVPFAEAERLLLTVVAEAGVGGLLTTNIRPRMTARDGRLAKTYSPEMAASGLIAELVRRARSKGLIDADETIRNNHRLRLTATGMGQIAATRIPEPRRARPLPGEDSQFMPRTRSQELIDTLRRADLGPFMEVRHAVYDAFEKELEKTGGDKALTALIHRAISDVRKNPPRVLADRGADVKYPWQRVKRLFEVLQSRCPIATGSIGSLAPSFRDGDQDVIKLVDRWRERLDGELIVELVRRGAELSYHDLADLAGALLGKRDDEAIAFLSSTLVLLLEDGRLAEGPALVLIEEEGGHGSAPPTPGNA